MLKITMLAAGAAAVLGIGAATAQIPPVPPAPPAPPPPPAAPPAPPAPPMAVAGANGVYEYTSPDGRHVTIISDGGRPISREQAERIRRDAMAAAANARVVAEQARRNAQLSAEQARRIAEEARRTAQLTREQVYVIQRQAMADAGRALREMRVYNDGTGPRMFVEGSGENARLHAEIDALRNEVMQLRREVESLRRGR